MNELITLIKDRRTTHKYKNQKVDEEFLMMALRTSLFAPNHHLTNPTRLYSLGQKTRGELMALDLKLKEEKKGVLIEEDKERILKKYQSPSHIIIVTRITSPDQIKEKEDYATLSCVIHNLSLILWDKGIGLKWSTGSLLLQEELYQILGLNKQEQMAEGIIRIGYPDKINHPPPRLDINEVFTQMP